MRKGVFIAFMSVSAFCIETPASARTIYFGAAIEDVPLTYGEKTILRFDLPVKTISNANEFLISPADPDNPDYATLIIEPRLLDARSQVNFILSDGALAKMRFISMPKNSGRIRSGGVYDIKSQTNMHQDESVSTAPYIGKMDLMTAMIRDDRVSGYEIRTMNRRMNTGLKGVSARLVKIYSGQDYRGYVFELKNISRWSKYNVDIRKLRFGTPNLAILASVDRKTLEPQNKDKHTARLSIVAKPGSIYKDIILPVRWVKEPNE